MPPLPQFVNDGIWLDQNDRFELVMFASPSLPVTCNYEVATTCFDPERNSFVTSHTPGTIAAGATAIIRPNIGAKVILLAAEVGVDPVREEGFIYVTGQIRRGGASANLPRAHILAGYPCLSKSVAYPERPSHEVDPDKRVMRILATSDPAAGAELSYTLPDLERFAIQSVYFEMVASAIAGNRRVTLIVDNGTNSVARVIASATQTAGQTGIYTFGPGLGDKAYVSGTNHFINSSLPVGLEISRGHRIRTLTDGIDGGDNFGIARILTKYRFTRSDQWGGYIT